MSEKEWKKIYLILPGTPRTKKNSSRIVVNRATGKAMVIPSQQYKDYEAECAWYLNRLRDMKIDVPVNVKCEYYMPTRRKVDLTNLLAATCDILVHYGVLADDNCNIVASHDGSRVLYSKDHPRVDITIEKRRFNMLNKIFLLGRLTRDPELRRTQTGTSVASFTLAVDRDFKGQNGEKQTDFIDCVAWKSSAEFVSRYFTKGRQAVVEGRLQMREWTDKDGNKRRSAEVVCDNVYFADSKKQDDAGAGYSGGEYAAPRPVTFGELSDDDGYLPF